MSEYALGSGLIAVILFYVPGAKSATTTVVTRRYLPPVVRAAC